PAYERRTKTVSRQRARNVRHNRRDASDDDPQPRQSGPVPVARRRSRMVVRVVLRLRPAIGCRRADDRPGRARRDLRRQRGAPDPRTERPLLWAFQDAARRLRRTRPGPDKGRRDGGRRRDVGSKFTAEFHRTYEPCAHPMWVSETLAAVVV